MTTEQAKIKAFSKLSKLDVDNVKELIYQLFNNSDPNASLPLDWALEHLESLIPSEQFVEFCDSL